MKSRFLISLAASDFPPILRRSIIGAARFHGRVRDGIGCLPCAITTKPIKNLEIYLYQTRIRNTNRYKDEIVIASEAKQRRSTNPAKTFLIRIPSNLTLTRSGFLTSEFQKKANRAISTG